LIWSSAYIVGFNISIWVNKGFTTLVVIFEMLIGVVFLVDWTFSVVDRMVTFTKCTFGRKAWRFLTGDTKMVVSATEKFRRITTIGFGMTKLEKFSNRTIGISWTSREYLPINCIFAKELFKIYIVIN